MEKGEDKIKNSPGGPGKGYINLPPRRSESCGYWLWLLAVLVAVSLEHKKIPPGEPITRGESFSQAKLFNLYKHLASHRILRGIYPSILENRR